MPKIRLAAVAAVTGVLLLVASSASALAAAGVGPAAPNACSELVKNGDFESEGANWTQEGGNGVPLITTFNPFAGQYSAELGSPDANNLNHRIKQQIVLPANQVISLSFWWEQWTWEAAPGTQDYLAVNLLNASGDLITELARLGVDPDRPPWEQLTFSLTRYGGQTVQLQFQAVTDSTNPTEFFIDNISVSSCSARRSYLPIVRR